MKTKIIITTFLFLLISCGNGLYLGRTIEDQVEDIINNDVELEPQVVVTPTPSIESNDVEDRIDDEEIIEEVVEEEIIEEVVEANNSLTTVWNTNLTSSTITSYQIKLYLNPLYEYDFTIDWGDGNSDHITTNTDIIYTYEEIGTYTVKINGTFPAFNFNNNDGKMKLVEIQQWGNIEWLSFANAFRGCENLQVTATDLPDLSNVTNMSRAFMENRDNVFNTSISNWDVSNVTNMDHMFRLADNFNQDISNWDVSNVNSMDRMFYNATSFTQDISSWYVPLIAVLPDGFDYNATFLHPWNN